MIERLWLWSTQFIWMMASEKTKCFLSQKDLDIIIHVFKIFQVELRSGLIASEVDDKNIFLL